MALLGAVRLAASKRARTTLKALEGAQFSPFGGLILLAYTGTTKPISLLSEMGDAGKIRAAFPPGYVMHDIVTTSPSWPVVVVRAKRVEEADGHEAAAVAQTEELKKEEQRLFEFRVYDGALMNEYHVEPQAVSDVTCAVNGNLTAVFMDTIPNSVNDDKAAAPKDAAKQLVLSTVRR